MPSKVRKSHAASQQEQYDALSQAIARVLFPVMICMALSVFLVHSLGDESKCRTRVRHGDFIAVEGGAGGVDGGSSNLYEGVGGIIFIGVFCAAMVVFTFALLLLYKHGCVKIIFAWLLLAVSLIFAYVGGVYLFEFCRSHCINIDWVTLVFVVWNFTITGLLAIFSTVPRRVNQAYLVVMSALMAYIFRRLPEWSTWTILMVLVAWDLFAVLTPCGPLRMLVKIAQERGDPLPALVYDTNPAAVGRDAEAQPAVVFLSKEEKAKIKADNAARREQKEQAKAAAASLAASTPGAAARRGAASPASALDAPSGGKGDAAGGTATVRPAERVDDQPGVGTLGRHLKLGLGDFVFYSILVAQASRRGTMTAITSFIAILTGLCATLFLVTVYRKALPALPISIVLGLVFYFLTRYTIQPFVHELLPELLFH
jgi:presenilin 1